MGVSRFAFGATQTEIGAAGRTSPSYTASRGIAERRFDKDSCLDKYCLITMEGGFAASSASLGESRPLGWPRLSETRVGNRSAALRSKQLSRHI